MGVIKIRKEELRSLYIDEKKTDVEIADMLGK